MCSQWFVPSSASRYPEDLEAVGGRLRFCQGEINDRTPKKGVVMARDLIETKGTRLVVVGRQRCKPEGLIGFMNARHVPQKSNTILWINLLNNAA